MAGNDVADVSDSGLVTATGAGQVIVQVSCAAFGTTPGAFTPSGIPATGAVYAEQTISVVPGVPITPDFSFTLSSSSIDIDSTGQATLTITQTALHGFSGGVYYRFYPNNQSTNTPPGANGAVGGAPSLNWAANQTIYFAFANPLGGSPLPGSGSSSVTLTATDAPAGTYTGYVVGTAASGSGTANNPTIHIQPLTVVVS